MARPLWLSICLVVALCLSGTKSQFAPGDTGIISLTLYIKDMSFDTKTDLKDQTSQIYTEMKTVIEGAFSTLGGQLDELIFSDGGGCVKVFINWRDGDQTTVFGVIKKLETEGIMIWGETWAISQSGCTPELRSLNIKFYVVDMPWKETFIMKSSTEYAGIKMLVESTLSDLGGEITALELAQNYGCVEFYVEWNAVKPTNILIIMSDLTGRGISVLGQTYKVQSKPCLPSTGQAGECPVISDGMVGICVESCNDSDELMKCKEGFKCCSNGCGHTCVRVDYAMKIQGKVILDLPYMSEANMTQRVLVEESIKMKIMELFNANGSKTILDVDIMRTGPHSYMNQRLTGVDLMIYFAEDHPNRVLMEATKMLKSTPLKLGSQEIRFIDVHYGTEGQCGQVKCHGICKEMSSGLQYCSCSDGFLGGDCSIFDCRKDFSHVPKTKDNYCINGGRCSYEEGNLGYECYCPAGYYGETCEVMACDLLINPCNNNGRCVGHFDDGQVCECNTGRGGLFCETSATEALTDCQKMRQLMLFVHSEIMNSTSKPFMKMTMKEMLHKLGDDEYQVPYCWARDSPNSGGYHSQCTYDVMTGRIKKCVCLSTTGEPNGYDYMGEGDCRAYSGNRVFIEREFYIHDFEWSDDLEDEESELYMQIKKEISGAMRVLGGEMTGMTFKRNTGCVSVNINWSAVNDNMLREVVRNLQQNGIMLNNMKVVFSQEPCPSGFDVNSCPPMRNGPPEGLLGLCGPQCQKVNGSCPAGQLCCSNYCGGTQCMEVGYFQKVRANITVALPYQDGLEDKEGVLYQSMKSGLESEIHSMMVQGRYNGYKATKILAFYASGSAEYRNTVISLEMWFTEKVPVESLMALKKTLMENGFDYAGENYRIFEFNLGEQGPCPRETCSNNSICVTRIGDIQQCVCPGTCEAGNATTVLRFTLYVVNLPWMKEYMDKTSMEYVELKRTVQEILSRLGGEMRTMDVAHSNGCVQIYVQWSTSHSQSFLTIISDLKMRGIMYKGERYSVQDRPCVSGNDVDSCPSISTDKPDGLVGLCAQTCRQDNNSCPENHKCCPTACGGTSCMEVGYLQRMMARISVNVTFTPQLGDSRSSEHQAMKTILEGNIHFMMQQLRIRGYKSTKILAFQSTKVGLNMTALARQMNTVIVLEMLFTEEIPVKEMFDLSSELIDNGFEYDGNAYTVFDLQYGDQGPCPQNSCSKGSICVTRIGGTRHCACPETRSGHTCNLKNCNINGQNMCQNKATCEYSGVGEMVCRCPVGYYGEFCEVRMCDVMTQDACNRGICRGDLEGWVLCECPDRTSGLFCEKNEADSEEGHTDCLDQRMVTSYALSVLNGSVPNNKMTIPMSRFLHIIDDNDFLAVPNCWPRDGQNAGMYHSYCMYHKDNGTRLSCFCTSPNGEHNYWYYNYQSGQCQVSSGDPCEMEPCMNNGECKSLAGRDYYCDCTPDYEGTRCERRAGTQCPVGNPLMEDAGVRQCRTSPCPDGFYCEADPRDRWTACCVKHNFLCDYNPCQAGGRCIASLMNHTVCSCPQGRSGLFCERTDNVRHTTCQMKQEYNSWLIDVLKTGDTTLGISRADLLTVLIHNGTEIIPDDICDEQGNFKHTANGIRVRNVEADKYQICLDQSGNRDPACKLATCDIMEFDGGNTRLCKNNAMCVGDVRSRLCDCKGTGHHGILCDQEGERSSTDCQRGRDIANLAIGILNGTVNFNPGNERLTAMLKEILGLQYIDSIFVPSCDRFGSFEYNGCTHDVKNPSMKKCHCATRDGDMIGEKVNLFTPPDNCLDGRPEKCPDEWGPNCKKPHWWCSEEVQCDKESETCSYTCNGRNCQGGYALKCIPTKWTTACDPQPCPDNKEMKCPRCGQHGQCFNKDYSTMTFDSSDMDDESDSDGASSMSSAEEMDYECMCDEGHSGKHCEIVDEICSTIPSDFCSSRCVGDLGAGILCECDTGMGGVLCNKRAHTPCEMRKALYDDAIAILKDEMTITRYDREELKQLVRNLVRLEDGETLPLLNCTDTGSYEKVQCYVDIDKLDHKECYCADYTGMPFSSNVKPYIGYDVCTGPYDPRAISGSICDLEETYADFGVKVCHNEGTCIYNPYLGKVCDCPQGFYGQFCQYSGTDNDEPKSMCEFLADMYELSREMMNGNNASWARNNDEKKFFTDIVNGIMSSLVHGSMAFKAECEENGTFKPATCLYNRETGEKGKCYCWNNVGPDFTREVEGPDSEKCFANPALYCTELRRCPGLECKYGHRTGSDHCPTCECKNPCENVRCGKDERCTMQLTKDCQEVNGKCSHEEAVCVSTHKRGVCPGYVSTFNSIIGGGFSYFKSSTCQEKCKDDADCEGRKKCCGVCGSMCMEPLDSKTCEEEKMKMEKQREFVMEARKSLSSMQNLTQAQMEFVRRIAGQEELWYPECDTDGYLFKPIQCMHDIDEWENDKPSKDSCHCVDRLGNKVDGANPDPMDPTSCNERPGACPRLEPSDDSDSYALCSSDLDCINEEKCCSVGTGQVCVEPVDTEKLLTTVDQLMMNACEIDPRICENNAECVDKWDTEGIVCECPSAFKGPFCAQRRSAGEQALSICERKNLAQMTFMRQFVAATSNPMGIVKLYMSRIEKEMKESGDYTYEEPKVMDAVDYQCESNGLFKSTQCIRDVRTWDLTHCYCVHQENGTEIPGTRMSVKEGRPFCEKPSMTCPVGQPLKTTTGYAMCENGATCPEGYTCQHDSYRRHYCCPTLISRGVCPSSPIQVLATGHCDDRCEDDEDCMSSYKCCQSTCGKMCVPAIDNSPSANACPVGTAQHPISRDTCTSGSHCHTGHYCKEETNQDDGICCLNFTNVDLCSTPPHDMERCSKGSMRYFYNITSKMCEKFTESGCKRGFNNFASLDECCSSCNGEGRCKTGTCPAIKPGVVATCEEECSADRHCPGKMICCSNGCGKTCVIPDVTNKSSCHMRQLEARRAQNFKMENDPVDNDCDGIHYIPRCERDGSWDTEQCQPALGLCWCVTPHGYYIPETMTRRTRPCDNLSDMRVQQAEKLMLSVPTEEYEVCPEDESAKCCSENLCKKKCLAYPEAECRINPCGECKAEFFNADGEEVDCDEGLSMCEEELQEVALAIQELQLSRGENVDYNIDNDAMPEEETARRSRRVRTDIPLQCQHPPETGVCRGFLRQWYFNPVTMKCDMFIWGMCGGNQNRFKSPEECYANCNVDSPCDTMTCSQDKPVCKIEYDQNCYMEREGCNLTAVCTERNPMSMLEGIFVPKCLSSGEYSYKQCHGQFCWCVNDNGEYQEESLTSYQPEMLECTADGAVAASTDRTEVCPNNKNPNIGCLKSCKDKVCPGHPDATCVVDLCSDDCVTMFLNMDGDAVECGSDECDIFSFDEEQQRECAADLPCDGQGVMNCPDSICEIATAQNCSKNPCALCMVDPCTCKPYFVDVNTKERLTHAQCNFLSVGLCEVKKCSILTQIEKASLNNIELEESDTALPDCESDGKFKSKQCMGIDCHCVDAFGKTIEKNADGTCGEIDPVKEVRVTFKFDVDFNKLKQEGKLETFKKTILDKLVEMGIDPEIIELGPPYQGSVKIDIVIKERPDSPVGDLAAVKNALEQSVNSGNLEVEIDGQKVPVSVDGTTVQPVTASQIQSEITTGIPVPTTAKEKEDDDDGGLDNTEKVIIGVVCGGVGLLIIVVIVYFACCKKKKREHSVDDNYDHIRVAGNTKFPGPLSNVIYGDAYIDQKVAI